jgi:hypothetical protein
MLPLALKNMPLALQEYWANGPFFAALRAVTGPVRQAGPE